MKLRIVLSLLTPLIVLALLVTLQLLPSVSPPAAAQQLSAAANDPALAALPQGIYLADGNADPGAVYRLAADGSLALLYLRQSGRLSNFAFSPTEELYHSYHNAFLIYRVTPNGEALHYTHNTYVRDLAFDANGALYFSEASGAGGDGKIYRLIAGRDGPVAELFVTVPLAAVGSWGGDFAFGPDGALYVSHGNTNNAALFKLTAAAGFQKVYQRSDGGTFGAFFLDALSSIYFTDANVAIYRLLLPADRAPLWAVPGGRSISDINLIGRTGPTPPATPTVTATRSATATATHTATATRPSVATGTPTRTGTPTATRTSTLTPTRTPTRTSTLTPTRTQTRTPTRTFTPTPNVNLTADSLEVTQGVQDLNNSVRLVKNKRTFVRFHVRSSNGNQWTWALLHVQRGGAETWLAPVNTPAPGLIHVRQFPSRSTLNDSFLFELPAGFREGTVVLTAHLNPGFLWFPPSPTETTYADNTRSVVVSFETVPLVKVVFYNIGYRFGGTDYYPAAFHRNQAMDWMRRAFPVSTLNAVYRSYMFGNASRYKDEYNNWVLSSPNCDQVNAYLINKKVWDWIFGDVGLGVHYYGLVSDAVGFMRGCAIDIPGLAASGPAGSGTWGWDFDGSYADWYTGHELAHTYGRGHANYCGAGGGPAYPYTGGNISPASSGNTAIFGFDIGTRNIYPPSWKDVMTYCDNQWLGDFTYEGLMSFFQTHTVSAQADRRTLNQMDRLLVAGSINPTTHAVTLSALYVIPNAGDVEPRTPGDYAIVLRGAGGGELARYPFTPDPMHVGADPGGAPSEELLAISELVPYVAGTVRVDITGPSGLLKSVTAGANAPTIAVTTPAGGEVFGGATITVGWTAGDADGDALVFSVQYSPDGGATWEMTAQDVTGSQVVLDAANVVSGQAGQSRFRVWASDGIHTTSALSGLFTVPNRAPVVDVTSPASNVTIAVSQTVGLQANVYDVDEGMLDDAHVQWTSSLAGALGQGSQLTVGPLGVGVHTVTVTATDVHGAQASDSVVITVVEFTEMPPEPTVLYLPIIIAP
jgi:hypothetical protein